jgi:uncharacterized protein (TIGR03000 family)
MKRQILWCAAPALAVALLAGTSASIKAGPQSSGHWPPVGSSRSGVTAGVGNVAEARLTIRLPQNAHLWIQGKEIGNPGAEYTLVSPALESGFNYSYQLKAQWMEGGAQIVRTRAVQVRAGESLNVDLTTEGTTETTVRTLTRSADAATEGR